MKKLILILVVALLVAGGWWFWKSRKTAQTEYQTAPVTRADLTQMVTATGTLNPVLNVQVGSQISGNIQKLFADYNSPVTEGQIIAQLDPAVYQAIVHQAEGDLANAQSTFELAKLTSKRKEELVTLHAAPQADLDAATAALHQAESTVKIKQANLEKSKVDLDHCTIYAPINGIVISRSVDVGQTVAASLSAPVIFTIANDLRNMQIDSNVAEADVGNVETDQTVNFTVDAFPYRTFHGKVVQVRNAPITVQNVVTYDTVIAVNNDDLKLKPGMTANVSVVVAERENALRIPNAALRFRPPEKQDKTAKPAASAPPAPPGARGGRGGGGGRQRSAPASRTVYVLSGSEPKGVEVKLGISDGVYTEVVEGLSENQQVITAATSPDAAPAAATTNPFGGGMRMR
ncbi:MAG: HlyD family secretion protein [Chthoniobacter sp.]|jgi:HlyD family secretion protein|nr:HlyD family secretion protein [Chthoniobacter sp.]